MPEFTGTLKPPRLGAAPSSPVAGQMYFDTVLTKLRYWNGTAWTDVTGLQGDTGPVGPPGYDSLPIGGVLTWSGRNGSYFPPGYVLGDGRRLTQALYPQGYDFAVQEATDGNPMWTYRTSDSTFTVPDYTNQFIYGAGEYAPGTVGGEETHLLTVPEIPAHSHPVPVYANAAASSTQISNTNGAPAGTGSTNPTGGGLAHNNMPPYVVLALLVKVAGATLDADVITGPPGPTGPASTVPGPTGPTGPGVPVGGSTGQVLAKATATDLDTNWVDPPAGTGGSVSAAAMWATGPGANISAGAAGWVPLKPGTVTKDPAGAFTVNADGSVTVTSTGWYDISATCYTAEPTLDVTYYILVLPSTYVAGGSAKGIANGNESLSGTAYVTAGQKVQAYAWVPSTPANCVLQNFSIARAGGPAGPGVPAGGSTGQVLAKKTAADNDTEWVAQTGGSGGGTESYVQCNGGATTATPAGDTVLPIGTVANQGSTPVFTRNANGSLTCLVDGAYTINATMGMGTPIAAGQRAQFGLRINGSNAAYDTAYAAWANSTIGWTGRLAVGDVLSCSVYLDASSSYTAAVGAFGVMRATGPKGDKGDPGTDIYAQLAQTTSRPSTTIPSQAWTLVPVPATLTITSASGSPDFTRNADGSLTINVAGNYHFEANLMASVAQPDGTNYNLTLCRKAGALPGVNDQISVFNISTGTSMNNYPTAKVAADHVCAVGDRIATYMWQSATSHAVSYVGFSAFKTGTGPKGDDTGVYVGTAEPTGAQTIWLDTDETSFMQAVPLVSALPSNPLDGQEVYFQDTVLAASGAVWHLRYRATSANAHKWEMLGGSDWLDQTDNVGQCAAANGFTPTLNAANLAVFTVPLAGVYDVETQSRLALCDAAASFGMGFEWTGAARAYDRIGVVITTVANGGSVSSKVGRTGLLAAGNVIQTLYTTNAGTVAFYGRMIRVRPVRVG